MDQPVHLVPALLGRRAVVAALVAAPVLELVEAVSSPLKDTSTAADLVAIDAHRGVFVFSVLVGLAATALYVPAFLGLARACADRSPVAARVGGAVALVAMLGFTGVRALQAVELETVRQSMSAHQGAKLVDGFAGNPLGVVFLGAFLGGSVVGTIALAVASWRAGLPRPAAVLLAAFPVVDLLARGHTGTIGSHAVLLVALTWFALALSGRASVRTTAPVPATA
jgi:hypothetical protein